MKTIATIVIFIGGLVISSPSFSDNNSVSLGTCMVDSLNGKERKQLANWIFFAIAAHPEINSYLDANSDQIVKSDKTVGALITRLLTIDCPNELFKANSSDPLAVQKAFELVGQVAMQELMTNQDVMRALTNYAKYADQDKINAIVAGK